MSKSDKTEKPTAKKKRDSRRKGQVARSQDLVTWAQMYTVAMVLPGAIGGAGGALRDVTTRMGHLIVRPDQDQALNLLSHGMTQTMLAVMPLSLILLAVGLVGHLGQTGLLMSGEGLKPKFNRLNPAKGLKKLLSPQSAWEAAKVLFRTSILAGVAIPPVRRIANHMMEMGHPDFQTIASAIGHDGVGILRNTAMAGLILAAVDYGIQKRRVMKGMMMTKQEVKDEHKQSDGDPHMKAAIRQRQTEMSRNRMMAEVPTATAVIVNPTHFAVAIRYEPGRSAPIVVAKGKGAIALRIREEAERHHVPIMQDIPLARGLYAACDLNQEIPVEMYEAVARVLAVVMALKSVA
ncbi:MAG: type secretion protein [Actinomycetia bacterium]|nr:type secretion protein [Actinomycetes bacterium]